MTLGRDFLDRILVVVWTVRHENYRLISAHKATPYERRQYEQGDD